MGSTDRYLIVGFSSEARCTMHEAQTWQGPPMKNQQHHDTRKPREAREAGDTSSREEASHMGRNNLYHSLITVLFGGEHR